MYKIYMMPELMLTKHPYHELNRYILAHIADADMPAVFLCCTYFYSFHDNADFWLTKIMLRFGTRALKYQNNVFSRTFYHNLVHENAKSAIIIHDLPLLKWFLRDIQHPRLQSYYANLAANYGHMSILEWFAESHTYPSVQGMTFAGKNCNLHIMQWMHAHTQIIPQSDDLDNALNFGRIDAICWMLELGVQPTTQAVDNCQNIHILNVLHTYNLHPSADAANRAYTESNVQLLTWLNNHGIDVDNNLWLLLIESRHPAALDVPPSIELANLAAKHANLEILEKFKLSNVLPTVEGANAAFLNRHTDTFGWLLRHGVGPDVIAANKILCHGTRAELETLAILNIYPNTQGANNAVIWNRLDELKWLYRHTRILPDKVGANHAVAENLVDVLNWLLYFGVVPDAIAADTCIVNNVPETHIMNTLRWLYAHGYTCTVAGANAAAGLGFINVLDWLAVYNIHPDVCGLNAAAESGELSVLERYSKSHSMYPDSIGANHAVRMGHTEVYRWLTSKNISASI